MFFQLLHITKSVFAQLRSWPIAKRKINHWRICILFIINGKEKLLPSFLFINNLTFSWLFAIRTYVFKNSTKVQPNACYNGSGTLTAAHKYWKELKSQRESIFPSPLPHIHTYFLMNSSRTLVGSQTNEFRKCVDMIAGLNGGHHAWNAPDMRWKMLPNESEWWRWPSPLHSELWF